MTISDRVERELDDLKQRRSPPDIQMDVIDSELPTLEGELDTTRNQEEAEYIDALQGLRELQAGDPVRWKVWRLDNPSGDRRLNGYCSPELGTAELTMENIARRWGGGKYRIRGTFSNGKFAGGKTVDIAGDVKAQEPSSVSPNQYTPSGSGFDMQAFLAMQMQLDAKREERSRESFQRILAMALPIAGQIAAALISRAAPSQPDVAGLITALRPTIAPPDPMDSMKKMMEVMVMSQKLNGGGDSDSLASILTAAAPYAQPVLSAFANRSAPVQVRQVPRQTRTGALSNTSPVQTTVPEPAPAVVLPMDSPSAPGMASTQTGADVSAPSQPTTQEQQAMLAQLKQQTDALVQMAEQGADPVETANFFWENVIPAMNDEQYSMLADFIGKPNAISQLGIFNTGVKKHVAFFEMFQQRVVTLIGQADQEPQNG